MKTFFRLLIIGCVIQLAIPQGYCHGQDAVKSRKAGEQHSGVLQLIETRNGKTSCWGVVIQLGEMNFADSVYANQLQIVDSKYNRDLKNMMSWKVDRSKKKLTIEFKPGLGDFGSGDDVTIRIDGSAFTTRPKQTFIFRISTDPL